MNNQRVYSASFSNITIGTGAEPIIELQVPDNTIIEILRAWLSPEIGTTIADEVIHIALYSNNDASTGGAALTEQPLTPAAAADPSNVTALDTSTALTIGATALDIYRDAYHLQTGWLYLPVPEERVTIIGGSTDPGDNFGIRLVSTSTATPNISGGIIWSEISAA